MMKPYTNFVIYTVLPCMLFNLSNGQSLARKMTVTLSQLSGVNQWNTKSGAVDGNYDRYASDCQCCADSGRGRDPWIEIDLGEVNSFTRIVVYGRTDIYSSINNNDSLAVELDNEQVHMTASSDIRDPYFCHIDFGRTMSARKIKLISKGINKRFIVCEVDVFYDSIISTRKAIKASSTYNNWQPSNAVDGWIRTNDPDVCLCCAASQAETDPWLKLDLGDTYFITLIQLYGRTDGTPSGQSFEGMRIDIDDIYTHTIPTQEHYINYYELFPTPDKIGRYIKLTLTGENRVLVLCEIVVYGGRVISINKKAEQVTTYFSWTASRAVDGRYGTNRPGESCSSTNYGTDPWLEVDLGPNHNISRIVIYGRTDGQFSGQSFVDINIQLDSASLQTIPEPDTVYWVDFYGFQLPSTLTGQLVKLVLQGPNQQLVVCELIIYGDCVDGYFGANCDQQCHCKGELCNNITGICPSGICEPGYKGDTCSTVCDDGTYGTNCMDICGKCRYDEVCNKVDGRCTDCDDGYTQTDATCNTICGRYTYGYNCTSTCSFCKDNNTCNPVDGTCDRCEAGYSQTECKTECQNGLFGHSCEQRCGMCKDNYICDKKTGVCPNGCADGYHGDQCIQSKAQNEAGVSIPVYAGSMAAVGLVLVLCIALFAVYVFRHGKQRKDSSPNEVAAPVQQGLSEPSYYEYVDKSSTGEERNYASLQITA